MHVKNILLLLLTLLMMATACKKDGGTLPPPPNNGNGNGGNGGNGNNGGGGGSNGGNGGGVPYKPGTPTAVGNPVGAATVVTIGKAGGTVSGRFSKEAAITGKFELYFPQGTFENDVQITVQPIENKCHNAAGPAFRFSSAQPNISLKKPAELTIIPDKPITPSEPEILISVQDPVIKVWKGGRGQTDANGRRKFKVKRLADWALFQNYRLWVTDAEKMGVLTENETDYLQLVVGQPVNMEVIRLIDEEVAIPVSDSEDIMIPLPAPANIVGDRIDAIKWKFNGKVITEPTQTTFEGSPNGDIDFIGSIFEICRYRAPYVLPSSNGTPLKIQIEAEVRGRNNGPVAILIKRFNITSQNEYKINGRSYQNAYAVGNSVQGYFDLMLRKTPDMQKDEDGIAFLSMSGAQPGTYPLNEGSADVNAFAGISTGPKKSWQHFYTDKMGNRHFGNGSLMITSIKELSNCKIIYGTVSCTLYDYDRDADVLRGTTTGSGKFATVVAK